MEELTITSTGNARAVSEVAQPVHVLDSKALARQHGDTLGSVLANTPGVANASFGPGVGRPVLRGMGANRVRIMINGNDVSDVSAMSSDHAVLAEPVNATQLEIIQGPATLLYGGGAIGGIINVVDSRIHREPLNGLHGNISTRASTADKGRQGSVAVDAGGGPWVLHLDGFTRRSDNYRAAGDGQKSTAVFNSDTEAEGGSVAITLVDQAQGHLGLAISTLDYDYGVPNDEGEAVRIRPEKTRYEINAATALGNSDNAEWQLQLSVDDYRHREMHDEEVAGLFDKDSHELKTFFTIGFGDIGEGSYGLHYNHQELGVCHSHDGCPSVPDFSGLPWDGSFGDDFVIVDGLAFSHETPMPLTETEDIAAFALQRLFWSQGTVELGLRAEKRTIRSDPVSIAPDGRQAADYYRDRDYHPTTVSIAATWLPVRQHKIGLSLARAQRAPDAEELFWNGAHEATFSYQLDNPDLDTETARTLDLTWSRFWQTARTDVAVFYYDFDGYIYNKLQAVTDPFHDRPVYRHEQHDARFIGAEISARITLDSVMQGLALHAFADHVRASLANDGGNLPRTPPASGGLGLEWQQGGLFARIDSRIHAAQNRVADNETPTGSYSTLNAQVAVQQDNWRVALKGFNLGNSSGENHVSYLKELAPVMARNIVLELSVDF